MQEVERHLTTLKTLLRAMVLMVQITRAEELMDLEQRSSHAQEHQQKRHAQLDEFQEVGGQLAIKAVATLEAVQENRQMVNDKEREEKPV